MEFKGRLKVSGDHGDGIPVDLRVEDVFVDLVSDGEDLGRWRADMVEVARLHGNTFSLVLDGEDMEFVALDPLGFAYDGVAAIDEIGARLRRRRKLPRRRTRRPEPARNQDGPSSTPVVERAPGTREPAPEPAEPDYPEDDFIVVEEVAAVSYLDEPEIGPIPPDSPAVPNDTEGVVLDEPLLPEAPPRTEAVEPGPEPDEPVPDVVPWVDPGEPGDQSSSEADQPPDRVSVPTREDSPGARIARLAGTLSPTPDAKGLKSRFARRPEAHTHDYQEKRTVGGITRRICAGCGHVSFAGEDIYDHWS